MNKLISESRLKELVSESVKHILSENARDRRVESYLKSKGCEDYNERLQLTGRLKHDIPNLRLDGNKFLLGACRIYFDRQLRDEQSIRNLDNALKFIHAGNHTEEFDENLNGKSPDELHEMFREASRQMSVDDRQRSANQQFSGGSQYRIIPINSYKEAKPYGKYTSWCVTHGEIAFDSYTQGGNRFYFCLKDGFENVPKDDNGAPLNEWGLSIIAVNIDMNGDLTRTTTRYNHDFNGENNPELETTEQLEKILNVPFYQTFKPYTREELHARGIFLFDEVQGLLDVGTPPREIFQGVGKFSEGFARVSLNGKWNFIDKNCKLLFNTWFDLVGNFSEGFATVYLNGKYNFIDKNGKFLSNDWFDYVYNFSEGLAAVNLNGKYNFIDKDGKLLSNRWFEDVRKFSGGIAQVQLNGKYSFIDKNGKLIPSTQLRNTLVSESHKPVRITESQLRQIVSEVVRKTSKEGALNNSLLL